MKHRCFAAAPLAVFFSGFAAVLLCSCATPNRSLSPGEPVRSVDASKAPEMESWVQRARQVGNETYPKICALLADGNSEFPPQFDISFTRRLSRGNAGEARFARVFLKAHVEMFEKEPDAFDQLLVHEMTHVAQAYYRPILGEWLIHTSNPPSYWEEGIADYVCFKLGKTNGWDCPQCGFLFSDYHQGYSCAGAFLLYLDGAYGSNLVRHLNTALRHGKYSDDFFKQETGKPLAGLWSEFQQTQAFTAGAMRMNQFKQELGYVNGRPPRDIRKRFNRYVEQHADATTKLLLAHTQVPKNPNPASGELEWRMSVFLYLTQPGGSAEGYFLSVKENHQLPGFIKGERGTLKTFLRLQDLEPVLPVTRTFEVEKNGDNARYHYTVFRASQETGWKMQRAWRTRDGNDEELSMPENQPEN
ncbi:MAG TPA: basic secretory protein-like protein [Candidatus Paceibacterota bacterium]|nr:basic secretory protein-like protein [Candidatus Paceibacterota bacterium]